MLPLMLALNHLWQRLPALPQIICGANPNQLMRGQIYRQQVRIGCILILTLTNLLERLVLPHYPQLIKTLYQQPQHQDNIGLIPPQIKCLYGVVLFGIL